MSNICHTIADFRAAGDARAGVGETVGAVMAVSLILVSVIAIIAVLVWYTR